MRLALVSVCLLAFAVARPGAATAAEQAQSNEAGAQGEATLVGSSVWDGRYAYPDGRPPVSFKLWLTVSESGAVSGRTEEPATFGNGKVQTLTAKLSGSLQGDRLSFVKQYDGKGGVNHGVSYSGIVADGFTSIEGTWKVSSLSGTFQATRAGQE